MDVSLNVSDASYLGDNTADRFGKMIACIGDLDKDGYDEFIVGVGAEYVF